MYQAEIVVLGVPRLLAYGEWAEPDGHATEDSVPDEGGNSDSGEPLEGGVEGVRAGFLEAVREQARAEFEGLDSG